MDQRQIEQMARQLAEMFKLNKEGSGEEAGKSVPSSVVSFHKAAAIGDRRRCRSFVEKGGDVNVKGKRGLTAMHIAAHTGHGSIIRQLLEQGADIEVVDEDGDTPLNLAIMRRQTEVAQMLVERGSNLYHRNAKGMTPADIAFSKGSLQLLEWLERRSSCLRLDCELHSRTLGSAAQEGECDRIEFWLKRHPERGICNHRYGDDRTLAFIAALNGRMNVMRLLDRFGADFEIADNRCHTPLFCATQNGHFEVAKFLVEEKGCNVQHESVTGRTAIFSACANGHQEIVRLLIRHDADVNHSDEDGVTPIECAIRGDFLPVFRLLIDSGASVKVVNNQGYDLAMVASVNKRFEMLQILKRKGVSVTNVNRKNGETALLAACQYGPEEVVEYLVKHGSKVNHRNRRGVSPALRAAFNGLSGVLKLLGEAGAELDLPNKGSETAALCAAQKDSLEMVEYLHGKGCNMAVVDTSGKTLAWYAAKNGNVDLLRFLGRVGAPMDTQDCTGCTPLILAVKEKVNAEAIKLLADEFKCSLTVKDKKGRTAVDLAKRHGRREILDALGIGQRRAATAAAERPDFRRDSNERQDAPVFGRCELDTDFTDWTIITDGEKKRPLGQGGFGKVYKALTDKHQFVAVKIVHVQNANAGAMKRAIESEKKGIELLKTVRHPNIVAFLKCESKGQKFHIFTELIAGIDLHELIVKQGKPFDERGVQKFTMQICSALNHLHTRRPAILHRDIKCSNIMLTHEGLIKLIDFGLAKEIVTSSAVYTTINQCGTLTFMAPELFSDETDGRAQYTMKSDVWALGCAVYEMSHGVPPNSECHNQGQIIVRITQREMPKLPDKFSSEAKDFYSACVVRDPRRRSDTTDLMEHAFLNDNQE